MLINTCNWKQTHIFPNNYIVSKDGQVMNIKTKRLLRPTKDKDGYLYYVLCVNGIRKTVKAHRLVLDREKGYKHKGMWFGKNTRKRKRMRRKYGIKHEMPRDLYLMYL